MDIKSCIKGITVFAAAMAAVMGTAAHAAWAEPSQAEVRVNGKPVDVAAYNIYNNNYFKLRDVAAAVSGTKKHFDVVWREWGKIYLVRDAEYSGDVSEAAPTDAADAVFSAPEIQKNWRNTWDAGEHLYLKGYNINDNNYFKIRDIARVLDLNVSYSDGVLDIDTENPYVPEEPYEPSGEAVGELYEADCAMFISECPIVTYYSTCDTVYSDEQIERIDSHELMNGVFVAASELEAYGFDMETKDNDIYLTYNKDKGYVMPGAELINSMPEAKYTAYGTDRQVYLDGRAVRCVDSEKGLMFPVSELCSYIGASGLIDGDSRAPLGKYAKRVNIDLQFMSLKQEGAERISNDGYYYYDGYWGGYSGDKYNGFGIRKYSFTPSTGTGALLYWGIERGEFSDGRLISGISSETPHYAGGSVYQYGFRIEGDRVNGQQREGELVDNTRFGYRIVREGEVENGEYKGRFIAYGEDGAKVFEGTYEEWEAQKEGNEK